MTGDEFFVLVSYLVVLFMIILGQYLALTGYGQ